MEEGLRMDRHPLIWFRDGAAEVATLLDISRHLVHAASDYYGEFSAEIDAWLDAEANFARRVEVPDRSG